jgi:uncharacterized membrane protein YciS (DUF1049 family)
MAYKIKDYIFTPADLFHGILYVLKNIHLWDIMGLILLVLVYFNIKIFLGWQSDSTIFFLFFFAIIYWDLDSRVPIALALFFLLLCPLFYFLSNDYNLLIGEYWAEQAAVWTFYLLVFGVVKQMWDFRKGEGNDAKELRH